MTNRPFIVLILVLVIGAGCAASPIDYTTTRTLSHDEVLVFGRARVLDGGDEINWDSFFKKPGLTLHVIQGESSSFIDYELTDSGNFYWRLPPGTYTIAGYTWNYGHGRIFTSFTVPKGEPLVYVGTLGITFQGGRYLVSASDDYEEAVKLLRSRYPDIKGAPSRHIMELEKAR